MMFMDLRRGFALNCASMWNILGWTCVGLGAIGAVLPVMPTVPFLLLAAFCFERGSPRLHRWLMEHKTFGPSLSNWRNHRVIRPHAKAMSVACISASVVYVLYFREFDAWMKVVMTGSCALVILFILMQRNYPPADGDKNGV